MSFVAAVISPALDALQPAPLADQPAAVQTACFERPAASPSPARTSAARPPRRGVAFLRSRPSCGRLHCWTTSTGARGKAARPCTALGNGGPQLAAWRRQSLRRRPACENAGMPAPVQARAAAHGSPPSPRRRRPAAVTEASAEELSGPPASALHVRGGLADGGALREGGWAAPGGGARAAGARTLPVEVDGRQWAGAGAPARRQQRLMRLDAFLDEQAPRTSPDLRRRTARPAPSVASGPSVASPRAAQPVSVHPLLHLRLRPCRGAPGAAHAAPSPLGEATPLAVTPTVPVTAARCAATSHSINCSDRREPPPPSPAAMLACCVCVRACVRVCVAAPARHMHCALHHHHGYLCHARPIGHVAIATPLPPPPTRLAHRPPPSTTTHQPMRPPAPMSTGARAAIGGGAVPAQRGGRPRPRADGAGRARRLGPRAPSRPCTTTGTTTCSASHRAKLVRSPAALRGGRRRRRRG